MLGLNARQVQSPPATGVQPRLSAPTRYVPLSQFFLQMQTGKGKGKKLFGLLEPKKNLPAAGKSEATTTANVAVTAVPLGMETDKRKLRRGKAAGLAGKVAGLLRRLF